jgi:hypothetical protein
VGQQGYRVQRSALPVTKRIVKEMTLATTMVVLMLTVANCAAPRATNAEPVQNRHWDTVKSPYTGYCYEVYGLFSAQPGQSNNSAMWNEIPCNKAVK